jgi:2-phospho-L-lactate transferase/gluconeogenesis factor (CofD/UPF0052 family)
VANASAIRLYVCNVATQTGETAGYDLSNHVEALVAHTMPGLVDIVLANDGLDLADATRRAQAVALRWPPAVEPVPHLATDDVADEADPHHHDPARLATAILRACEREAPSLRRERVARSA